MQESSMLHLLSLLLAHIEGTDLYTIKLREGLHETPKRILSSWEDLFYGYNESAEDHIKHFSSDGYDGIVLLKDIEFYSMCEHHMLPFFGRAHVAYLPGDRVIGVSKLARILDVFARRLQIQERIGEQVTHSLMTSALAPKGAACVIESKHMCMACRGVEKQHSVMVTSSLKGVFLDSPKSRAELFNLIGLNRSF